MSENLGDIIGRDRREQRNIKEELGRPESLDYLEFITIPVNVKCKNLFHDREYLSGSPLILDHVNDVYGLDSGSLLDTVSDAYIGTFRFHESLCIYDLEEQFTGSQYKHSDTTATWTTVGSLDFSTGSYAESCNYNLTTGSLRYYLTKFDRFRVEFVGSNTHKITGSITVDGTNYLELDELDTLRVDASNIGSFFKFKLWNDDQDAYVTKLSISFYSTGSFEPTTGSWVYNYTETFTGSVHIDTTETNATINLTSKQIEF